MNEHLFPATKEEWRAANITQPKDFWVARVQYWDEDQINIGETVYYKFNRAYEIRISDFYANDKVTTIYSIQIL
jgi:hypothetical protein